MKRILRIGLMIVLTAALLLSALRLAVRSDRVLAWLSPVITDLLSEQIDGRVQIGSLRGDLLYGFVVRDLVLLNSQGEELGRVGRLEARYLLTELIQDRRVRTLSVSDLTIRAEYDEETGWNWLMMMAASRAGEQEAPVRREGEDSVSEDSVSDVEVPKEPSSTGSLWGVDAFTIDRSQLRIESSVHLPDSTLVLQDLTMAGSVQVRHDGFKGSLEWFSAELLEGRLPEPVRLAASARAETNPQENGSASISAREGSEYSAPTATISTQPPRPVIRFDLTSLIVETGRSLLFADASLTAAGTPAGTPTGTVSPENSATLPLSAAQSQHESLPSVESLPSIESLPPIDSLFARLLLQPLSQADLKAYQPELPLQQSVNASLAIEGAQNQLALTLTLEAETQVDRGSGAQMRTEAEAPATNAPEHAATNAPEHAASNAQRATLQLRTAKDRLTVIEYARLELNHIKGATLTGIATAPDIRALTWTATGEIPLLQPLRANIQSDLQIDGTEAGGLPLDRVSATFTLKDSVLTVLEASVTSPMADLTLSARQHITDWTSPENRLLLEASIRDISAWEPMKDRRATLSGGTIRGTINPNKNGDWQFNGSVDLQQAAVDTIMTASAVQGEVHVTAGDAYEFETFLSVQNPVISSLELQDAQLTLAGRATKEGLTASTRLDIQNKPQVRLMHQSDLEWRDGTLRVTTDSLLFSSPVRDLMLQKPFDVIYSDGTARVDTLFLESADRQSFFMAWAPEVRSERQEVQLYVQNIRLDALQHTVLEEPIFEATLSGSGSFVRDLEDGVTAGADLLVEELAYEGNVVDSVVVAARLSKGVFAVETRAVMTGRPFFGGRCVLPAPWSGDRVDVVRQGQGQGGLQGRPGGRSGDRVDGRTEDRNHGRSQDGRKARVDVDCRAQLFPTAIRDLASWMPETQETPEIPDNTDGLLSATAVLSGDPASPAFQAQMWLREARLSGIPVDSVRAGMRIREGGDKLSLTGDLMVRHRPVLTFEGEVPVRLDVTRMEIELPDEELSLSVKTDQLDLAVFDDFLQENSVRGLKGELNGELVLQGRADQLRPAGSFSLKDGGLEIVPLDLSLTEAVIDAGFDPERVAVQQYSVRSGPGILEGSGFLGLRDLMPDSLSFDWRARRFELADTRDLKALADVDGTLSGTMSKPVLTGSVNILSGFLMLRDFGEKRVEEVDLADRPQGMGDRGQSGEQATGQQATGQQKTGVQIHREHQPAAADSSLYDRLTMDISVRTDRRFFIRNREFADLELELQGDVSLVKDPGGDPVVFGMISGVNGYAKTLGKEFELDRAEVTFSGDPFSPQFFMRTSYRPPQTEAEIEITYIIEGTLAEPVFRFESEPEMELQDIISYTVFGKPFYELQSWEQVVAGSGESSSAADLAMEILLDRVELLASEQLGIDVVRIDHQRSGSERATSILTGWYLNRRAFFAMINELSSDPKTLFVIEYLLRENLELILTQGDDSRQGVDIRWEYDY